MIYLKRATYDAILKIGCSFRVLLLTGPRQVGKTTLLKAIAQNNIKDNLKRNYVTLDDPDARYLAKHDPRLFMQRYPAPILIDEIKYAPELLPYIKIAVDNSNDKGQYWLTGTQNFSLMNNVSESLAGRVGIVNLLGLSSSEIYGNKSHEFSTETEYLINRLNECKKKTSKEIFERIVKGSNPELYNQSSDISSYEYYKSYVNTYLERDIRCLSQVGDELEFYNFMKIVASHTSKPLIYDEIAKEANVSAPTAKKWISILVSTHIIALVSPFHNNVLKRIVKAPIIHFLDTGLVCFLLKWQDPTALEDGHMAGSLFETYVFSEIYKSFINQGKEPPIYYYRDKDKKEIDLLLYQNGTVYPIEIKLSASPSRSAIKNFKVLEPIQEPEKFGELSQLKVNIGQGAVICMCEDVLPIDQKNNFVPVWLI